MILEDVATMPAMHFIASRSTVRPSYAPHYVPVNALTDPSQTPSSPLPLKRASKVLRSV